MTSAHVVSHFNEAVDWDAQRRIDLLKSNKRLKGGLAFVSTLAVGAVISAAVLAATMTFVPIVVRVDQLTGAYDVSVGWPNINMADPKYERTVIADMQRYVKSLESFTRAEAEDNYKTAWYMSCGSRRDEVARQFNPNLNENALANIYTERDRAKVDFINYTVLPTDKPDYRVSQVRFDRTEIRGTNPPVAQRYIATIQYRYTRDNVPSKLAALHYNAFGFCALSYRADPEGPPRVLKSPDAAGGATAASQQQGARP